jgi:glycerol-3-phosphate acyltransferase PlsY
MSRDLIFALFLVASFLLGSIPFGIFVGKKFGIEDLRRAGSGNIGATNVTRLAGFWPAGFLTLLLDVLKGLILLLPIQMAWISIEGFEPSREMLWSIGAVAVLGHCFSPWLKFNGGKGVATCFGVLFVLSPWSGLAGMIAFGIAYVVSRVGAIGSLTGLFFALFLHLVFYPLGMYMVIMGAMMLLVLYRHEPNLDALLKSREQKI